MFARTLCPALVAFACLFSIGNSDSDLGLEYNIRSPENQAIVQQYYDSLRKPTEQSPWHIQRPAKQVATAGFGAPAAAIAPVPAASSVKGAAHGGLAGPLAPVPAAPSAGDAAAAYSTPADVLAPLPTLPAAGAAAYGAPAAVLPPFPAIPGAGAAANVDVAAADVIANGVLRFAQDLSREITSSYRKTTIFSPLSVISALALLMLGAKGRSYAELSSVFGLSDTIKLHEQFGLMLQDVQQPTRQTVSPFRQLDRWHSDSIKRSLRTYPRNRSQAQEVHVANGLFVQQGYSLNPNYKQAIAQIYKSELIEQDFENHPSTARYNINSWVDQHTKGKIRSILGEDLPQETRMILANALYFKAIWEIDFIAGATKLENFYPNGEGTEPVMQVETMAGAGAFPYYEDEELNCRIVGLPYSGNMTTMYIMQPRDSSVEKLEYLQQRLTPEAIESMISKMIRRSTVVLLPKMHIVDSFKLQRVLKRMGIIGIFNPVQNDLSLITESTSSSARPNTRTNNRARSQDGGLQSLYNLAAERQAAESSQVPTPPSDLIVGDIIHKVDFTVNEQGTEAAASSAAILKKSGPEVTFRAETPFIVMVRHDLTKLPLFYGVINEPPTAKAS